MHDARWTKEEEEERGRDWRSRWRSWRSAPPPVLDGDKKPEGIKGSTEAKGNNNEGGSIKGSTKPNGNNSKGNSNKKYNIDRSNLAKTVPNENTGNNSKGSSNKKYNIDRTKKATTVPNDNTDRTTKKGKTVPNDMDGQIAAEALAKLGSLVAIGSQDVTKGGKESGVPKNLVQKAHIVKDNDIGRGTKRPVESIIVQEQEGADEETEEEEDNRTLQGNVVTVAKKNTKRVVGTHSFTIRQVKDAVTRTQAVIAVQKVNTLQAMTQFSPQVQPYPNAGSVSVLLHWDEIVPRPDLAPEFQRARDRPMWTLLCQNDIGIRSFGMELERLGKAMQKPGCEENKIRSFPGRKGKDEAFDMCITFEPEDYLRNIYGDSVVCSSKKRKTNKDEE